MMNESKGNMYGFVSHTKNYIKGKCSHNCSYCYMKRWGEQKPVRLDEKEFNEDLGENNFIFVGSSTDMFADDIETSWILKVLDHCKKYPKNKYLFQSKNPKRMYSLEKAFPENTVFCTTLESNRFYKEMGDSPSPKDRIIYFGGINGKKMLTIEPIMDFDLEEFVTDIKTIQPFQVNIGADSQTSNLPEPSKEKILALIKELEKFTVIANKKNILRLLK